MYGVYLYTQYMHLYLKNIPTYYNIYYYFVIFILFFLIYV